MLEQILVVQAFGMIICEINPSQLQKLLWEFPEQSTGTYESVKILDKSNFALLYYWLNLVRD